MEEYEFKNMIWNLDNHMVGGKLSDMSGFNVFLSVVKDKNDWMFVGVSVNGINNWNIKKLTRFKRKLKEDIRIMEKNRIGIVELVY